MTIRDQLVRHYAVQFADAGYHLIIECHGGNWPIIALIETNFIWVSQSS